MNAQSMYGRAEHSLDRSGMVLVTGGGGMLGKALVRELRRQSFTNVLAPARQELDLLDAAQSIGYLMRVRPRYVFHLASVVFGLLGNMKNQLRSFAENTALNSNALVACAEAGVTKLFFAGTVASYPYPYAALPLREEMLWQGKPHYGEFGYANAKRHALAHLEILERELNVRHFYGLLTNLYGPEDRFDDVYGHVIPALIKKMDAALVSGEPFRVWGDGSATRDFLHAEDAARAIIAAMDGLEGVGNIASGTAVRIRDIVDALCAAAGYTGEVIWETDKPTGIRERSVADDALRELGFRCEFDIRSGIRDAWLWYTRNRDIVRV